MNYRHLIKRVLPALVVLALWLDGWFYPLILLPFLFVILEKRGLGSLGFNRKRLVYSVMVGLLVGGFLFLVYCPLFLLYLPLLIGGDTISMFTVFTDVIWYPLYEEVAYRGFALSHYADMQGPTFSSKNNATNLLQALLFLSIHHKHVTAGNPLVLIPVFLLGLLNGYLFIKTRNIAGCIVAHSTLNGLALLIRYVLS